MPSTLQRKSLKDSSITNEQPYETKNYLKSHYIDEEWIETLKERNEKRENQKHTDDQKKLLKLKKKIAAKTKTGDTSAANEDKLLTLMLQYGMPRALKKVKKMGFE